jgi:D-alanyl-D-alanine dipeptidase
LTASLANHPRPVGRLNIQSKENVMLLLSDNKIAEKPVVESREQLVDFRACSGDIMVDLSRKHIGNQSDSFLKARRTVVEKVISASKDLPKGIKFLIKEAYRPSDLQQHYFDSYCAMVRKQYPGYSMQAIYRETSKYVAPVNVAPHPTGGAVDLTLAGDDGAELDLGTRFNASPTETQDACFTSATHIPKNARMLREILIVTLSRVGMVNYPTEWWHWSFGDKYWAVVMNKAHAIYGPLEEADLKCKGNS